MSRTKSSVIPEPEQGILFPDAIGVQDCIDAVDNQINNIEIALERLMGVKTKLESMAGSGLLFHAKFSQRHNVYLSLDLTLKL